MIGILYLTFLITISSFAQNNTCGFNEVMEERYLEDSSLLELRNSYEIEIQQIINSRSSFIDKVIPVVVHIIYNDSYSNISNTQVYSAMTALNEDFNANNSDFGNVVSSFNTIKSDLDITFSLAQLDPNGNSTNGITRTESDFTDYADENVKSLIIWDPNMYLNVWVVDNIESGAGAYAYYPGTAPGGAEGIVCRHSQFGTTGTSSNNNFSATTFTHEVGHYLNLAHTWGDSNDAGVSSNCNIDDNVSDTPNTEGTLYGCNTNQYTCGTLDNVQNFMDYTDCTNMFTEGQRSRVHAALHSSMGGRVNLWQDANLISTGLLDESECEDVILQVNITTGSYANEVSWVILDAAGEGIAGGGANYSNNSNYNIDVCIIPGSYTFQSIDSYGDGWNGGSYTVYECGQNIIANIYNPSGYGTTEFFTVNGCSILGCNIPSAINFNPDATENDGSCIYSGCMDEEADNYNALATEDSGYCIYSGCMDEQAINYDSQANNQNENSCIFINLPELFNFNLTGSNHTIVIPDDIIFNIVDSQLSIYDAIGVFYYDDYNVEKCGGYVIWEGNNTSIAAQGDDSTTEDKDGFMEDEFFKLKVLKYSSNEIYDCSVNYSDNLPNQGQFTSNGISALESVHSFIPIQSQDFAFPSGWSLFSSYLFFDNMDISIFFQPIENSIIVVKDFEGMAYLPEWNYNGIGDMTIGQAYQIKLDMSVQFTSSGNYALPENNSIELFSGWNLIGYLRISSQNCEVALESINSEIIIAKDGVGNAYLPEWNFNAIGNLSPGRGYQIKMNSFQEFFYSPN